MFQCNMREYNKDRHLPETKNAFIMKIAHFALLFFPELLLANLNCFLFQFKKKKFDKIYV